ncbi:ATP-binding protein [Breoghania corrubedonensis]|nr:ATP-binding protein [Breoghania corrubedonensis]
MTASEPEANQPRTRHPGRIGRSMQHKIMLLVCCCVFVSSVVVGIIAYNRVRSGAMEETRRTLVVEAQLMAQRFRNSYSHTAHDLRMLAGMPPIQGIIRSSRNGGIDPMDGSSLDMWRQRLTEIFDSLLSQRPDNFQIRYIGLADGGRELVRVDRGPAGNLKRATTELQRKGMEDYFALGVRSAAGKVVFSEVTYNREFGKRDPQDIPTIRGILPIFDQFANRFGMLVINSDYDKLLRNAFIEMRPRHRTIVVNGQGDYMEHTGKNGAPLSLELHNQYTRTPPPVIKQAANSAQAISLFEEIDTINVAINTDKGFGGFDDGISIIIQVPKAELYAQANRTGKEALIAGSGALLLCLIGSLFFARAMMGQLSDTAIAIVENVTDGLILVNSAGTIERFNPGCERIFGYHSSEVVGKPASILLSQEFAKRHEKCLSRYRKGGGCAAAGSTIEMEGRTKADKPVPIEISINELNLNGRIKFSGVMRDISERRKMERIKTEFVSTVSHELRTPLTSIRGSLGLVGKMVPDGLSSSLYQMISLAQKNTDRLITLVNDILDFEKLSSREAVYDMKLVNVQEALSQAVDLIRGFADQLSIKVEMHSPDAPLQIMVDVNRFQQILANLLSNAIKFSPASGTVMLAAERSGDAVCISIRDEGPGIPEGFKDQIFTPFSQADSTSSRKFGGTGLGLSITKRMVEDMEGTIDFENEIDKGTTFRVSFPVIQATHAVPPIQRSAGDGRMLGLHVEDDGDFAAVLAEMFNDTIRLEQARSLAEAREYLAANTFDLIVIDVALRDGNGLDLLNELPPDCNTDVIVITAIDSDFDDPRIDLVIVKSKRDQAEIGDRITELLNTRRTDLTSLVGA